MGRDLRGEMVEAARRFPPVPVTAGFSGTLAPVLTAARRLPNLPPHEPCCMKRTTEDHEVKMNTGVGLTVTLRVRMGAHDAHYAGELVDGARMLALFGDVATELLIRLDGDEGLFRAYE